MRLAGYLDVESLSWEEMPGRRPARLRRRGLLLFFPEGHRSRDGRLQRFHSGAFKLAVETGVPVVPLVHHRDRRPARAGTRAGCSRPRSRLTALPAIDPAPFTGPEATWSCASRVKEPMEKALRG